MDEPPPGRRVFPDTNVLYPISLLDLIMRLAEVGAHTVVWSDDLLAELEQVWAEGRAAGKRVPNARGAASAIAGIRRTFPASLVPRSAYEARIDGMPGDDHDDKPHLAAAEAGRATHLITRDRAGGFPVAALAELGIQVQDPDEYLAELADEFPEDCMRVVQQMVERRQRRDPEVTLELLLDRWSRGLGLDTSARGWGRRRRRSWQRRGNERGHRRWYRQASRGTAQQHFRRSAAQSGSGGHAPGPDQ